MFPCVSVTELFFVMDLSPGGLFGYTACFVFCYGVSPPAKSEYQTGPNYGVESHDNPTSF